MSKFCIQLNDISLPDAIAAVVEAWYDAQVQSEMQSKAYYSVKDLQSLLNKSRASVYRHINTTKGVANPPFDPQKLNHEFRGDITDPMLFTLTEVDRWRQQRLIPIEQPVTRRPISILEQSKPDPLKEWDSTSDEDISVIDYMTTTIANLTKVGKLKPGDKMPSIRDLADKIGCHRNTCLKAYKTLEESQILVAKPGSGYYLANRADSFGDKEHEDYEQSTEALDLIIANLNQSSKIKGTRLAIERRGKKLAIRGKLPLKSNPDSHAYQRISLGISADQQNTRIAEIVLLLVSDQLNRNDFNWDRWTDDRYIKKIVSNAELILNPLPAVA